MKIHTKELSLLEVLKLKKRIHKFPRKPNFILRRLVNLFSKKEIKACNVKYVENQMENLKDDQPCLILMNHSCFLDLKIAFDYFKKRKFNIVCTSDGFVGKEMLMRFLGCIPTDKFVTDITLFRDMNYALKHNNCSVLMFPEASYSFDGKATPLPVSVGKLIKILNVPVVTVITKGAFLHDPLYNNLQTRKVDVTVEVSYMLTPEQIKDASPERINASLGEIFSFDSLKYQRENNIKIAEPFRDVNPKS